LSVQLQSSQGQDYHSTRSRLEPNCTTSLNFGLAAALIGLHGHSGRADPDRYRERHSANHQPYHAQIPPNCTATRDSPAMMFKICRDRAEMSPVQSFSICIILPSPVFQLAVELSSDSDCEFQHRNDTRNGRVRSDCDCSIPGTLRRSLVEPQTDAVNAASAEVATWTTISCSLTARKAQHRAVLLHK
jgi:hypothetical protein